MSDILSEKEKDDLSNNGEKKLDLNINQKDTLGEIGNISMGTAATTLSSLLNQKVLITTPVVKVMSWDEISNLHDRPCVGIKIDYTVGLKGTNILILKDKDVKIISNLMISDKLEIEEDKEITDIDLSAIGEAMNQMIGSSSTSLASIIDEKIDIDVPSAFKLDFENDNFFNDIGFGEDGVVAIIFRMQIGDLIDSEIMQLLPKEFAIDIANKIREEIIDKNNKSEKNLKNEDLNMSKDFEYNDKNGTKFEQNKYNKEQIKKSISVQPAQFQNFDTESVLKQKENIDILMDVPLEVTVELGKTSKKIKEILEFSPGTIIELDKLAGEPIDILVNGKYVAKGEVVVIDENFAIRVTSIINSEFRI